MSCARSHGQPPSARRVRMISSSRSTASPERPMSSSTRDPSIDPLEGPGAARLSWPEPGPMLPLRAAPALISLVVHLASSRGAAQIEAPRPVEELAPDTPAPRLRTRREPPRTAPPPAEEEQETPEVQAQEPA